ncbi:MAG: SoxR reducing system RseC family protein [Clostridia bacterium]|nr:SoxR reducing system RseC family protein [Clostridia bacterium]
MRELGVITEVTDGSAKVSVDKKTECDKCGMCLFPKGASKIEFDAKNSVGGLVGDTVEIETERDGKLLGAILVFLVPLILIGLSALIGYLIINSELSVLIMSLCLIVAWFAVLSLIDKKLKKTVSFSPVIIRIIKEENTILDKQTKEKQND